MAPYGAISLAVLRGDADEATPLIATTKAEVMARGEGAGMVVAHWANTVLMNGLARYPEALAAARAAIEDPKDLGVATWSLPELVEAAVRSGHPNWRPRASTGCQR